MEELRIDPTIAYDVVELPSRGIHYSNNKKSLRVAYLTAADENILSIKRPIPDNLYCIIDGNVEAKICSFWYIQL